MTHEGQTRVTHRTHNPCQIGLTVHVTYATLWNINGEYEKEEEECDDDYDDVDDVEGREENE